MKIIKHILLIGLAFSSSLMLGQEVHIHFDAHTKEIKYFCNGKELQKPKVKKGSEVVFHLQNFNNFLYAAEVQCDKEEIQTSVASPLQSIVSGSNEGNPNIFSLLSINPTAKKGLSESKNLNFNKLGYGSNVEESSQLSALKQEYDVLLKDLQNTERQLLFVSEDVDQYLDQKEVSKVIFKELKTLKRNPRLQPAQIKSLSVEYLQKIFGENGADDITLSAVIKNADSKSEVKEILDRHINAAKEHDYLRSELLGVTQRLNQFSIINTDLDRWKKSASRVIENNSLTDKSIAENGALLQKLYSEAQKKDLEQLIALRYEYEAISQNDFSEIFRFEASGDYINIKVKLKPQLSPAEGVNQEVLEFAPIKVPVYGGLKVNTSMGLSFGKFVSQPKSYFIRDSLISSQTKDKFTPLVTSFFHFYPQRRGQLSIGGSFGIGFPIAGDLNLQSINFLLGPSIIIGKDERLVISAGILGGKTEKLAKGLEVGDSFFNEFLEVPTYSSYELGYFLGFSFNLFSK